MSKDHSYQKLPGRALVPFKNVSLWQGPDHLLWVEAGMAQEYYKRFYFQDIQSIAVVGTRLYMLWYFLWGLSALLFALIAVNTSGPPFVSGTLTGLCLVAMMINFLRSPSCEVYLQTAVQVQKISSLCRLKSANKAMDRIKPLIEAAQGRFDPAEASLALRKKPRASPQDLTYDAGAPVIGNSPAENILPFRPLIHRILFALMLAAGLNRVIQTGLKSFGLAVADALFLAATLTFAIVALVQWHRQCRKTWLIRITWMSLVLSVVHGIIAYGLFIYISVRNPDLAYNHWALFQRFFSFQLNETPAVLVANGILAAVSLVLGALGLLSIRSAVKKARSTAAKAGHHQPSAASDRNQSN